MVKLTLNTVTEPLKHNKMHVRIPIKRRISNTQIRRTVTEACDLVQDKNEANQEQSKEEQRTVGSLRSPNLFPPSPGARSQATLTSGRLII